MLSESIIGFMILKFIFLFFKETGQSLTPKSITALELFLRVLKAGKCVTSCFISKGIPVQPGIISPVPFCLRYLIFPKIFSLIKAYIVLLTIRS